MAIITLNNNSLSSVTSLPAAITTGKVLQVVHGSTTTEVATSSPSQAQVDSGLSVSITPSSTSNKILVLLSIQIQESKSSNTTLYWRTIIKANGSSIHSGNAAENVNNNTGEYGNRTAVQVLHSPNSTSQQTYTVEVKNDDGAADEMVINRNGSAGRLTLMEIEG